MSIDQAVFSFLNSLAGRWTGVDTLVLFFGVYAIYLFVPLFLFDRTRRTQKAILTASLALCGAFATNALIGLVMYRERPFLAQDVYQLFDVVMPTKSFPSDHSALAFAAATTLFLFSKKSPMSLSIFLLAAFIALARVIGGVHYPLDVIAGAGIGVCWGVGAYVLSKRSL